MIAQPLFNRHIFKVTEQNIDDLATWDPPSSITDYRHFIIGVTMSHWPNDLFLQPLRMEKLKDFAIRFTYAHHLTIYYYNASPRGPFDPDFESLKHIQSYFYDLKNALKVLQYIETIAILRSRHEFGILQPE
jgi:hypothetical protein